MSRYSTENHAEFHLLESSVFEKYLSSFNSSPLIAKYLNALALETAIYKWTRRSEFTKKKVDADHQRDGVYTGIAGMVRFNLKHFDPQVREASENINFLMEEYGDVPRKNYDAETLAIDSFIARICSATFAAAADLLALPGWVDHLEVINNRFKEYADDTLQ